MAPKTYNINYALYDENDKFIEGFDSYEDMKNFFGCARSTLSAMFIRFRARHPESETYRYPSNFTPRDKKKKVIECSQQIYDFYNSRAFNNGRHINRGSKIYKFWLEEN